MKSPGFTVVVLVILAVGIGANTAMFSVVNAVMLRALPFKDPDRIVTIEMEGIPWTKGFQHRPNFYYLREHSTVFESVAGVCFGTSYVTEIAKPQEMRFSEVTWNMFPQLGVQPILGRDFVKDDERPDSPRVAVLSHTFWKEQMGGSPDVIGQRMGLTRGRLKSDYTTAFEEESYTIIGVMPPGFNFPHGHSVPFWTPVVRTGQTDQVFPLPIVCRAKLKQGVTEQQANAELARIANLLDPEETDLLAGGGTIHVQRLLDRLLEGHRRIPLLILGAAGFVLLIACSNVANLFLARAAVRQREMAMRLALGASRGRIIRQMLTESLLVSLAAGVLGLVLTGLTVKGLVRLCPSDIPRLQETRVDLSVLGFTLGASMLTGLVFGLIPAWRASDVHVNSTLKQGMGQTSSHGRWRHFNNGLVVSQLGLSLILLIGAALLIRSLVALGAMDLGFRPENVLAMEIHLPEAKYRQDNERITFFDTFLEQLRVCPGVRSAGVIYQTESLTQGELELTVCAPGHTSPEEQHSAPMVSVSPGFFEAMGVNLLSGQPFSNRPEHQGYIINKFLADKCFPDSDPVGQVLLADGKSEMPISGVVDTIRDFTTPYPTKGAIYRKGTAFLGFGIFVIRTDRAPVALIPTIRAKVAQLEKDQIIKTIEPVEMTLSRMLTPRRFVVTLLGLFAAIALTLAALGLYGLLQYSTAQQTHDIGIRMALGAEQTDVRWMVLRRGLKLTLVGIVLGIAGAVALTRVLSSLLYDVTPTDPVTLLCVSIALSGIALLACYLPARRAARIDPMVALRYE